jgi:hypothetical protein
MVVVIWLGGLMFRQLLGMRLDQRLFCYLELFLARLCSAYRSRVADVTRTRHVPALESACSGGFVDDLI